MTVRIITGDCRTALPTLADRSVHCCVTSPPYFGLRDYGMPGQLGLEATPAEFVDALVRVFREVRRVLVNDGVLWLILGDCYAGSGRGGYSSDSGTLHGRQPDHARRAREASVPGGEPRTRDDVSDYQRRNTHRREWGGRFAPGSAALAEGAIGNAWVPVPPGLKAKDLIGIPWRVALALQADGWWLRQCVIWHKPNPMPESCSDRCTTAHEYVFLLSKAESYYFDAEAIAEPVAPSSRSVADPVGAVVGIGRGRRRRKGCPNGAGGETRNRRSVWTVPTRGFEGAHFATMPPALAELCIRSACPPGGTVLDPFGGAGTTGLVADALQRHAVLVELNPAFAAMGGDRIEGDAPLFAEVAR